MNITWLALAGLLSKGPYLKAQGDDDSIELAPLISPLTRAVAPIGDSKFRSSREWTL